MPDDDLTPREEQVRRLLSEARHDEPMPDDVAARLDEVLAGLRVDRPPVDLAARQRRRHVRNWILAAAAVVVVGVGVNQVEWSGMSESDDAGASADSAAMEDGDAAAAPSAAAPELDAGGRADWRAARIQLTADRFGDEVQEFRASKAGQLLRFADGTEVTEDSLASGSTAYATVCAVGDLGRGHRVPVRYDGERAWLVFRPEQGETQVVDLYLCGREEPTRSITLPAP